MLSDVSAPSPPLWTNHFTWTSRKCHHVRRMTSLIGIFIRHLLAYKFILYCCFQILASKYIPPKYRVYSEYDSCITEFISKHHFEQQAGPSELLSTSRPKRELWKHKMSPPFLLLIKCFFRDKDVVLQRKPTSVSFQLFRDTELMWKVYICKSRCGLGEGEAVVSEVVVNWPLPTGHSWYKVINAFTVTCMQ